MPTPILSPYAARGRSSYRNVASGSYLSRTTSLPSRTDATMCGWFVRRSSTATYSAMLSLDSTTGSTELWSLMFDGDGVTLAISNGAVTQSFNSSPAQNQPFFAAITSSGSTITGYWAPPSARSLTTATMVAYKTDATTSIAFGSYSYSPTNWTDCNIWNVKVFNRALSAAEVLREMLSVVPVASGLKSWFPLEGNLSQLQLDYSGNNQHLTQNGTGRAEPFFLPAGVLRPARRRSAVFIASGTLFTQTLTCSTTTSAAIVRQANAIRAASATASAALSRAAAAVRSASITTSATAARATAKSFSASSTASATVVAIKTLLQSLTTSSALSATLVRQAQAVRAASSTLSATVVRSASRTLAAATTASATAVRQAQRALSASTSLVATTVRSAGKALAASSTLSATLATLKQAGGMVLTATITTSASLARSISKGLLAGIGQIATLTLPLGSSTISDVIGRMRRRLRR